MGEPDPVVSRFPGNHVNTVLLSLFHPFLILYNYTPIYPYLAAEKHQQRYTMSRNRASLRNTHFYDAANPSVVLGGFWQQGSITEATCLSILEKIVITGGEPIRVERRNSTHILSRIDQPIASGQYDVYCDGKPPIVCRIFW